MLYTSPISQNYRLFFHQFTGYADLGDGQSRGWRKRAGLEYRRGASNLGPRLHQSIGRRAVRDVISTGPGVGRRWRLAANFDSDSNDHPGKRTSVWLEK